MDKSNTRNLTGPPLFVLKWDGSDITTYVKNCQITSGKYGRYRYLKLVHTKTQQTVYCIKRRITNTLSLIIDELKPIFGLSKMGTHRAYYKGDLVLLIRVESISVDFVGLESIQEFIRYERTLKESLEQQPDIISAWLFRRQVQEIFAFRELLGISRSYESTIRIRTGTNFNYPISFYELSLTPYPSDSTKQFISDKMLNKWFYDYDVSLDDTIKRMLNINTDLTNLTEQIMKLRDALDDVIYRIDKSMIAYSSYIIDRILHRLQGSL